MFQLLARAAADGKPQGKKEVKLLRLSTLEKNNTSNQGKEHNSKVWYCKEWKMIHSFFYVLNIVFLYMALNNPVNKGGKKSKELPYYC